MMSTMEEEPITEIRNDLEEGELSDSQVGDVEYTPLTRPDNLVPNFNPASIMSMNIRDDVSDESDLEQSSEDDSDSDNPGLFRAKKPKIKIKRRHVSESAPETKNNKYKIWCKTAGEDTLTEDLLECDVARNKTCYGVESYSTLQRYDDYNNYNGKHSNKYNSHDKVMPNERPLNNKRNYRDRKNVKLRLGRRVSIDSDPERGETKYIPDLALGIESTEEDLAKDLAEKLQEEKPDLILKTVQTVGKEKSIELFKETKRIEEDGGMMIMNGTRRRTPGGVFIFLLKRDKNITRTMINSIFEDEKKMNVRQKKTAQEKKRNIEVEQLKQSLTDGALPALRTRAEQWVASSEAREDTSHVSNPPPSPVTDGRDGSSDADTHHFPQSQNVDNMSESIVNMLNPDSVNCAAQNPNMIGNHLIQDPRAALSTSYDDDYIDITCNDDMDLF